MNLLKRSYDEYFKDLPTKPHYCQTDRFLKNYRDRYALIIVDDGISTKQKLELAPYTEVLLILDCDTLKTTHIYSDGSEYEHS